MWTAVSFRIMIFLEGKDPGLYVDINAQSFVSVLTQNFCSDGWLTMCCTKDDLCGERMPQHDAGEGLLPQSVTVESDPASGISWGVLFGAVWLLVVTPSWRTLQFDSSKPGNFSQLDLWLWRFAATTCLRDSLLVFHVQGYVSMHEWGGGTY